MLFNSVSMWTLWTLWTSLSSTYAKRLVKGSFRRRICCKPTRKYSQLSHHRSSLGNRPILEASELCRRARVTGHEQQSTNRTCLQQLLGNNDRPDSIGMEMFRKVSEGPSRKSVLSRTADHIRPLHIHIHCSLEPSEHYQEHQLCGTYIWILKYTGIDNHIIHLQVRKCSDLSHKALYAVRFRMQGVINRGYQTVILVSDVTSHSNSWQAPRLPEPARDHSADALAGFRTVAMTRSPLASSCFTNSSPIPLLAPTMTQVDIFWQTSVL